MTLTTFRGRCHTCGHDHDAEDTHLRDLLDIVEQARRTVTLPPLPPIPVGALTDGEAALLRAWAERYARAALRAAGVEVA